MADLTTAQYAYILNASDQPLPQTAFAAVSSDPTVASIGTGNDSTHVVIGQSAGTATITVTRNSDSAIATLEVSVEAVAPGTFEIHLGAPVAR
jgi:uncharacterized protein YjdB